MSRDRILILRTGGLGDSLLLWPAIAGMRRRFPQAQIDCMGHQSRLGLLCNTSGADNALDVNGSGLHLLFDDSPELPVEIRDRFGVYSTAVAFQSAGDFTLAQNLADCGVEEVHAFLPFPPEDEPVHVAEHCLDQLTKVDLAKYGPIPTLSATEAQREIGRTRLADVPVKGPIALLAPGSGSREKNWPTSCFAELAKELERAGWSPLLLQGPADQGACTQTLAAYNCALPIVSDQDPHLLMCLISHVDLFVGNDSGPTHLAGLMGCATVALFGPSDPLRWKPLGERVAVVCSDSNQMHDLPVSRVWSACLGFVQH